MDQGSGGILSFTINTDSLVIVHGPWRKSTTCSWETKIICEDLQKIKLYFHLQGPSPFTIAGQSDHSSTMRRTIVKLSRPCLWIHCGKIQITKDTFPGIGLPVNASIMFILLVLYTLLILASIYIFYCCISTTVYHYRLSLLCFPTIMKSNFICSWLELNFGKMGGLISWVFWGLLLVLLYCINIFLTAQSLWIRGKVTVSKLCDIYGYRT